MDRIASEGARFLNAFVTTPLCSPSRASFLTGQYVHKHGILDNSERGPQSHELRTFPQLLQAAGYETAFIGKWHMSGKDDSARPGFDHWISFRGQGRYVNCELNRNGNRGVSEGYITDILSQEAVDFIRTRRNKPFALCLCHKAIHGPFEPAARHRSLYSNSKIEPAPSQADDLSGKPVLAEAERNSGRAMKVASTPEDTIRNMARCLASVDEGLGLILDALRETGQLDQTFIVLAGDNGYFYGEHRLGDKRKAYEEGIRIPFLIRYPPLVAARSTPRQMVLNVDLAPTVLQVAGAPVPGTLHGRSILPLLQSPRAPWRESILTEYFVDPGFPATPKWQSIRTLQWKYIHYPDLSGKDELYDLKSDPHEMKNLIARKENVVKRMQAELKRLLAATA